MKVVAISDTHCKWNKLVIPECDLLISAGDFSFLGEPWVIKDFHKWLNKTPARHIISLMGNHERWVESNFELAKQIALEACPRVHFIDEGLVEIEGYKIWTSAVQPWFCNWSWNRWPGEDIQKHWDRIPENTDVIVTHGPCYGVLDSLMEFNGQKCEWEEKHLGCPQLLKKVLEVKPKLHVAGYIHPGYGIKVQNGIIFVNASICNDDYRPVNLPIIIAKLMETHQN